LRGELLDPAKTKKKGHHGECNEEKENRDGRKTRRSGVTKSNASSSHDVELTCGKKGSTNDRKRRGRLGGGGESSNGQYAGTQKRGKKPRKINCKDQKCFIFLAGKREIVEKKIGRKRDVASVRRGKERGRTPRHRSKIEQVPNGGSGKSCRLER